MEKEVQDKIAQIQQMEQSMQQFLMQKQQIQTQMVEVDSALTELSKTDTAYKIVGNIMVLSDIQNLKKEMDDRKEMLQMKSNAVEKQEEKLREKTKYLQQEVMASMDRGKDKND